MTARTRTRTLGLLLSLLLIAALVGVYLLNETAGRIMAGLLAGATLGRWGHSMAETFTRPAAQGGRVPPQPTRTER